MNSEEYFWAGKYAMMKLKHMIRQYRIAHSQCTIWLAPIERWFLFKKFDIKNMNRESIMTEKTEECDDNACRDLISLSCFT